MALVRIVRDVKKCKIHFHFGNELSAEVTEYVIDELAMEDMLRIASSMQLFIKKRIGRRSVSADPETLGIVFARAEAVLGSKEGAWMWLREPQRALGGKIPLDMLWSLEEAKKVIDLLGRIEHGVIS